MGDFLDFVRYLVAIVLIGWAAVAAGRQGEGR